MALSRWSKHRIRFRWLRRWHKVHYGMNGMFCDMCHTGYQYGADRTPSYLEWYEFHRVMQ